MRGAMSGLRPGCGCDTMAAVAAAAGCSAPSAARSRALRCCTRTSIATVSWPHPDTWDARGKITSSYDPGHSTGIRSWAWSPP